MALTETGHVPASTYRVQLNGQFTFADLSELVPYFSALGMGDFYFSPILAATPGSLHGYDVTDYGTINPELGGADGFDLLASRLRTGNIGVILDFVPNHMGIAGLLNDWWRDVLENGRLSPYEGFFDIQWNQEIAGGRPRVLVPVLEDHYGKVLEEGKISLICEQGAFGLRYSDLTLPVNPACYADILSPLIAVAPDAEARDQITGVAQKFAEVRTSSVPVDPSSAKKNAVVASQLKTELATLLASHPAWPVLVDQHLRKINGTPGEPAGFSVLHSLIEEQHYRLARWKTGTHEINYRRFFAIDSLVGLHMERPEVFRACHELVGRLIREGKVAGLRIDHIDGLRQPEDYLRRLQSLERPLPDQPLYVLVEKILSRDEALPEAWPVHGTTGYEFIPQLAALFVDPAAERTFNEIYRRVTGDNGTVPEIVHAKKRLIITELFYNAASNLGAELVDILSADRRWRDLTRHELTTAVTELMANLHVYRTYRRRQEIMTPSDRKEIADACSRALALNPRADPEPFEFVRDLLIGIYPDPGATTEFRAHLLRWVLTFQQYTGAVMAKAVEDTAFYTYNRLIALNEVGDSAEYPRGGIAAFHHANVTRQVHCPHSMLTTSTHDTKVSEDVRARLYALSEVPGEWDHWLAIWLGLAGSFTTQTESGAAPDALDLYRLFQTLLGVWPINALEADDGLRERVRGYFRKAVSEAKRHTSILQSNEAYLAACDRLVDGLLGEKSKFIPSFLPFARRIARLGCVNSLAQLVLKCTSPGVPDFYQGNEVWDFSLVDPDNRRVVDFPARRRLLEESASQSISTLMENWWTGGIKLRVTQGLLSFRRTHPELFSLGHYQPLATHGEMAEHVVAFTRSWQDQMLLVVVPRLCVRLGPPPLGLVWEETLVTPPVSGTDWADLITGEIFPAHEPLLLRKIFSQAPFAVLHSPPEAAHPSS